MKFFVHLGGLECVAGAASFYSYVYGPFATDRAMEEEMVQRWPNGKEEKFLVFEGDIVSGKSPNEKPENEKRKSSGNLADYILDGLHYKCRECGAIVRSVWVIHPVYLRSKPGVRSGEDKKRDEFYCPNCEKEPNPCGDPVYID